MYICTLKLFTFIPFSSQTSTPPHFSSSSILAISHFSFPPPPPPFLPTRLLIGESSVTHIDSYLSLMTFMSVHAEALLVLASYTNTIGILYLRTTLVFTQWYLWFEYV